MVRGAAGRGAVMCALLALSLAWSLASCGSDGGSGEQSVSCDEAFDVAAAVPQNQRRPDLLYDSAVACESIDEWNRAASSHPELLQAEKPRETAESLCTFAEDTRIYNSPLCRSLGFRP